MSLRLIFAASLTLLLGACASSPEYNYDFNPEHNYKQYQSYRWYDDVFPSKEAEYRQYNASDERVRKYFDHELKAKNIRLVSHNNPDLLINYHISSKENFSSSSFDNYYGKGVHGSAAVGTWGSGFSIGYSTGSSVRTYKEGTLVIDILDAEKKQLIWRGITEGRLPKDLDRSKRDAIIHEAAEQMIANFPPRQP